MIDLFQRPCSRARSGLRLWTSLGRFPKAETRGRWIVSGPATATLLLAAAVVAQTPTTSPAPVDTPDPVCEVLFRTYACAGKVNTADREAAIVLVASRGREKGFWRVVLQKLRETDDQQTDASCVLILGRMLAAAGRAREDFEEQQRTDSLPGQWSPTLIALDRDESVVDELLKRAGSFKNRNDSRIGYYVEALAAARDPRTREYLLIVMRNGPSAHPGGTDCFRTEWCLTAAIGLAGLREPAGVEWLVQNCESQAYLETRRPPLPYGCEQLGSACLRALNELRDDRTSELNTRAQWQAWWDRAKADFKPSDPEPVEHKEDR